MYICFKKKKKSITVHIIDTVEFFDWIRKNREQGIGVTL